MLQMHSDKRLKHSRELLYNIKLVKLYVWEALFNRDILKTRDKEIKALLKVALPRVISCMYYYIQVSSKMYVLYRRPDFSAHGLKLFYLVDRENKIWCVQQQQQQQKLSCLLITRCLLHKQSWKYFIIQWWWILGSCKHL